MDDEPVTPGRAERPIDSDVGCVPLFLGLALVGLAVDIVETWVLDAPPVLRRLASLAAVAITTAGIWVVLRARERAVAQRNARPLPSWPARSLAAVVAASVLILVWAGVTSHLAGRASAQPKRWPPVELAGIQATLQTTLHDSMLDYRLTLRCPGSTACLDRQFLGVRLYGEREPMALILIDGYSDLHAPRVELAGSERVRLSGRRGEYHRARDWEVELPPIPMQ